MDNYKFEEEINNKKYLFRIYYEGTLDKKIDFIYLEKRLNWYLNNIDTNRNIAKIIGDVRTIFKEFNEIKLLISYKIDKKNYNIGYLNNELVRYDNQSKNNDLYNCFSYNINDGISFDIKGSNIIKYNYNECNNIYLNNLKELYNLRNISYNELNVDILYINEIYKLFYGKYPNYSFSNINIKIQNMVYILKEYDIKLFNHFNFSNNNDDRIPMCNELNDLINDTKPYLIIDSRSVYIESKYKEIIKIIRESINNTKSKEIDYAQAVIYLSMVLYASKYNLKLGFDVEDIIDKLNCSKLNAEHGLRLCKGLNKYIYEKN